MNTLYGIGFGVYVNLLISKRKGELAVRNSFHYRSTGASVRRRLLARSLENI